MIQPYRASMPKVMAIVRWQLLTQERKFWKVLITTTSRLINLALKTGIGIYTYDIQQLQFLKQISEG